MATAPTSSAEDRELAGAVTARGHGDATALAAFLARHPKSGWAASIWTNQGLAALHDGYFSQAITDWKNAWTLGRDAGDPRARAMVDRAVGELARLYASLGRFDDLKALLGEIGTRPISGSATEAVQMASDTLALIGKTDAHLYDCGPTSLRFLLLALNPADTQSSFLPFAPVGPQGASLAELIDLAGNAGLQARVVVRKPGQPVPIPSVVNWKVGHYGAIVGMANGRYHLEDPVFPGDGLWVTEAALDAEASGYFLIPASKADYPGWRRVNRAEAAGIRGRGQTSGTQSGAAGARDGTAAPGNGCPMCGANIRQATVGITMSDTPVGYSPPIGPSAKVTITYNQREDSQPANFNFFNVSQKWTLNWLTYITDDPTNAGGNVSRYLPGGGSYDYSLYNSGTGAFAADTDDGSILVLKSQNPVVYERLEQDGSIEVFSQSNGATSYPRQIFLSQVIDPQGNAVTLSYDGLDRLTTLTDAAGRQTTFAYGQTGAGQWLVTRITDPFGRNAALTYDQLGRLASITDILGITSSFSYDANSLANSLTTPYGTSTFAYTTAPGTSAAPRFADITDPLGYHQRVEWLEPAPIPDSDPAATVPQGMATLNQYLTYRDSFYWDPAAYVTAGCSVSGGCDYTEARDTHFLHVANVSIKSTTPESIKYPLENRIWFNYLGQLNSIYEGTFNRPSAVGRVLDDGTTQLRQFTYDTTRAFKLTQSIDPLGRVTGWSYPNHIDLAAVTQGTAYGFSDTLAQISYNIHHRPILVTGPDSQTTSYMYNAAGQVTSTTNALGQTTQFQYNATSDLTSVINANGIAAATYTYDAFDRVATFTDSEGWTVACTYDPANRITGITYPDGTAETNTYRNLDLISHTDRQGRTWTYSYDADRRLISGTDPAGQQTLRGYDPSGRLTSLTDPKGNVTAWTYDIEGRLTAKTYADSSTLTTTYENTTSRVYAVADALGQTKQYTYAEDDNPIGVNYLNAVNATPNVSFTWDPFYPRPTAMTDGTGTTTYTYVPVGSDGALQRQQETPPLAGAAITYGYDALGRLASRTASGAGTETFAYDAIGRVVTHTSDLGSFTLTYLGQTGQVAGRSLSGSSLATNWSYLPNSGDRRLAGITNVGLSSGQTSSYQYTTTPENFISGITETSDQPIPAPPVVQQSATYNNLNQLTTLSGQTLTSDAAGTLTYTWDAENRLIGIGYPGQPGKATAFTYDGLGRRVAISSTPAGGGSATTTSYIWCGLSPCQARNAAGAPVRGYYAEGEMVSGSPVYYGVDQLGSVRRAFANAGSAPAYEFDPYGNPLQTTPPLTDYGYAGMMYNADSGLYLTPFRAYDPVSGRWLSRDPIGENGGLNLYAYVNNDPLNVTDPSGMIPNGFSASAMGVDGCGGGVSGGGAWSIIPAQLVIPGMGVPPPPGTVATDSLDQSAQALSNAITNAVHGNSLDSQSRTYVYQLVDQTTGETLKYGITSNLIPQNRYSQTFYDATNSQMQVLSSWSNRGFARAVELGYTGGYFITNGQLPPLSKVP